MPLSGKTAKIEWWSREQESVFHPRASHGSAIRGLKTAIEKASIRDTIFTLTAIFWEFSVVEEGVTWRLTGMTAKETESTQTGNLPQDIFCINWKLLNV